MLLIGIMLALSTAIPMEQFSSPGIDELGYALMESIGAEPVQCPSKMAEESFLSIMFCGQVAKVGIGDGVSLGDRVDATLLEQGANATSEWIPDGRREGRKYSYLEIPLKVIFNRKSGVIALRYPAQFPRCLQSDLPLATMEGEEIIPPVYIKTERYKMEYPEPASKLYLDALIVLQLVVTKSGTVEDACVSWSSRPGYGLEKTAIERVQHYLFKPAVREGNPLDVLLNIQLWFTGQSR